MPNFGYIAALPWQLLFEIIMPMECASPACINFITRAYSIMTKTTKLLMAVCVYAKHCYESIRAYHKGLQGTSTNSDRT